MATKTINPTEFFAVHYKSTADQSIKFYCAVVNEFCMCGAAIDKPHNEGCTQKEPVWFGRSSWQDCAEMVVANSIEEATKSHKERCNL